MTESTNLTRPEGAAEYATNVQGWWVWRCSEYRQVEIMEGIPGGQTAAIREQGIRGSVMEIHAHPAECSEGYEGDWPSIRIIPFNVVREAVRQWEATAATKDHPMNAYDRANRYEQILRKLRCVPKTIQYTALRDNLQAEADALAAAWKDA